MFEQIGTFIKKFLDKNVESQINKNAADNAFIYNKVTEWETSVERKNMFLAEQYYANQNEKILQKNRLIAGRKDTTDTSSLLSNTKLSHAFMKKLVNQKASYLVGRQFSVATVNKELNDILEKFFDKPFFRQLLVLTKEALKSGKAWLYVYYDEQNNLRFKHIPSYQIKPIWKDADHTELEAIIRVYSKDVYNRGQLKTTVKKIEYYSKDGIRYLEVSGNQLIKDPDVEVEETGHFTRPIVGVDGTPTTEEVIWNKIPFICFKYNSEELGVLSFIKSLIDDYDENTSNQSDDIHDVPNSVKVVKNYSGKDKDTFSYYLNKFRVVFVEENGGVDQLDSNITSESNESHLDRLRADIYEFAGGVDVQRENFATTSGIALKLRYADLDLDANFMEIEFQAALENIIWFIKQDTLARDANNNFLDLEVEIIFNKDLAIDEQTIIANIVQSSTIISKRTCVAQHPWVTDVDEELAQIKKEQEEQMALMEDFENNHSGDGDARYKGGVRTITPGGATKITTADGKTRYAGK